MKTTNNVQKANLKSAVAAATLVLAMVFTNAGFATGNEMNSMNAYLAEETEEALEMEAWMTTESNFYATVSLEAETEIALNVENWMTNENNFYTTVALEAETENAMELGSWMTDANNFYTTVSLEAETEEALEMEAWMTNEINFYNTISLENEAEETIEVEDWMKNDSLFSNSIKENEKQETVKKEKKKRKCFGTGYQETNFGRRAFIMFEEDEPKLRLEQWMLDYKYWNGK